MLITAATTGVTADGGYANAYAQRRNDLRYLLIESTNHDGIIQDYALVTTQTA